MCDVSVVLCTYNVEDYIYYSVKALLNQTVKNFEIIIVDDSTDSTGKIIKRFNDQRIKYFKNNRHLGISKSRNKAVKLSSGKYVFFTDADCIVSRNWIEQGLQSFANSNCVGVEGKTYYVSKNYIPSFSDSVIQNLNGGQYMTCNIAYQRSILERIGGFDERYDYYEDRDLALRIKKLGEQIIFNPNMIVYHQKNTMTPASYMKRAKRIRNRVLLFKKFHDNWSGKISNPMWRIVNPLDMFILIYPPFVFQYLLVYKFREKADWALFPYIWIRKLYERLNLWQTCAKQRVLLI